MWVIGLLLVFAGSILVVLGVAVAVSVAIKEIFHVTTAEGVTLASPIGEIGDVIKALSAAPLWIAFLFVGVLLILIGLRLMGVPIDFSPILPAAPTPAPGKA